MIPNGEERKYTTRRVFCRIRNFVWSLILTAALIALAVVLFRVCTPWLQMLWTTVR